MKFSIYYVVLFGCIALYCTNLLHAYGGGLLVMKEKDHFVKIIYDIHAHQTDWSQKTKKKEKQFISNIFPGLKKHLKIPYQYEAFFVENGRSRNVKRKMYRLHKHEKKFFNDRINLSKSCAELSLMDLLISIAKNRKGHRLVDYDLRSEIVNRSDVVTLDDCIDLLSTIPKGKALEAIRYARNLPFKYYYARHFTAALKSLKKQFSNKILKNIKPEREIFSLYSRLADYGLLSLIGMTHKNNQNAMLYVGHAHGKRLKEDLINMGYEVVYEVDHYQGNPIATKPVTREECEKFFGIKQDKEIPTQNNTAPMVHNNKSNFQLLAFLIFMSLLQLCK